MKKLLSIILSACILLMVIPFEAAAVDVSYPYFIDEISYNNGTVTVKAKGTGNVGGIHLSFYLATNKVLSVTLPCTTKVRIGESDYFTGTLRNADIPGGSYKISAALTTNTGENGENIEYVSNYKMIEKQIGETSLDSEILAGIIISLITGGTVMQVLEDTVLYSDTHCTNAVTTVQPGSEADPVILKTFTHPALEANIIAVSYEGQILYTYSATLGIYQERVKETVTDDEIEKFVKTANLGIYKDNWTSVSNKREYQTGKRIIINDINTGAYISFIVTSNRDHLSVECATKDDANRYSNIVGKWNAGSRPVWVYSKDKIYAASLGCQIHKPSKDATINNGLNGYFELYFNGCTDSSGICSAVHNSSINSAFNRGSAIRTSN